MRLSREFIEKVMKENLAEQHLDELDWVCDNLYHINPEIIIEIGVRRGGTLRIWDEILSDVENNYLLAIDIQIHPERWNLEEAKSNLHFLHADTRKGSTIREVKTLLGNRLADFIYIDGDHGYEVAKNDFNNFQQFVRPGGLVAFHDIWAERNQVGVFWKELVGEKYEKIAAQGTGIYVKE